MAAAKQIPAMVNKAGASLTSWDDMAAHAVSFFENVLGGPALADSEVVVASSPEQRAAALEVVSDRLTPEEKLGLNAPFQLAELREAVDSMKRLKCPGPDGAPVELFQTMWATMGPLVLQVLNAGIDSGSFHEKFSQGLITLLPKKGDQRSLSNKPPITLLNVVYKIGAKVLQRRLTPILQRIISPQQSAFLPGRNIHHSLVMLGEMLHQAAVSGEEHVLLNWTW